MERNSVEEIKQALEAAREAAASLDGCDMSDIEEIIAPVEAELRAPRPNIQTLSTYLNSLAKSLRADPAHRATVMKIDAAMRNAGVPTHWEH